MPACNAYRLYNPSGPYTDNDAAINVERGLKRLRVEWVKERGGVEEYDGRAIKPIDNDYVSDKHLAHGFPVTPKPLRGLPGHPVTQLEWARRGVITEEMIYVAERENQQQAWRRCRRSFWTWARSIMSIKPRR